jgi:hypothetical protein
MVRDLDGKQYSLGIDPGWKNLGIAVVSFDGNNIALEHCRTENPSQYPFPQAVLSLTSLGIVPTYTGLERYVSYKGVNTAEAENILMLIGALRFKLTTLAGSDTLLYRAIDWKTELVKSLVKLKQFDNPSMDLDKKFSIAAANACLDINTKGFNTDHEADAICIASRPFIREKLAAKKAILRST